MNAPLLAVEVLLAGPYSDVAADDVHVAGLEVFAGEGRTFGTFPDEATRDAAASMLARALAARDEIDGDDTTVGALAEAAR